jgi:(p)ppGpp synthase/HD superfamily hydrolase
VLARARATAAFLRVRSKLMTDLEHAILLALQSHAGGLDKSGEPYILHVLSVMLRVAAQGLDERHQITAVLHDICEDTPVSLPLLRNAFGDEVADALAALTRMDGEPYALYIERVSANNMARLVKLADLQDNLAPHRARGLTHSLATRYLLALEVLVEADLRKGTPA